VLVCRARCKWVNSQESIACVNVDSSRMPTQVTAPHARTLRHALNRDLQLMIEQPNYLDAE
jgi:hypothetical protein